MQGCQPTRRGVSILIRVERFKAPACGGAPLPHIPKLRETIRLGLAGRLRAPLRPVIGTGFTIEVDGRQYLITAKHLTGETDIGEIEVGSGGITVGQSVRFLGFPLGIAGNSGILIATGIETALKLIASNPIGFPVAAKRIGDGSSAEQ